LVLMIATVAWMLAPSGDAASALAETMARQWRALASQGIVDVSSNHAAQRRKESANGKIVRTGCELRAGR
jgi:hypothetical protein